jgi:hypothetical protein
VAEETGKHVHTCRAVCLGITNDLPWCGEPNHQYPECIFSEYTLHDTCGIFYSIFPIDTVEHTLGIFNENTLHIQHNIPLVYSQFIHLVFTVYSAEDTGHFPHVR